MQEIKDLIASKVQERKCLARRTPAPRQPPPPSSPSEAQASWHHTRNQSSHRGTQSCTAVVKPSVETPNTISPSHKPKKSNASDNKHTATGMPTIGRALKPEASVANRPRRSKGCSSSRRYCMNTYVHSVSVPATAQYELAKSTIEPHATANFAC